MELERIIRKINIACEKGQLKVARYLIDTHLEDFNDNNKYMLLNDDARTLVKVARQSKENEAQGLTRHDILVIGEINKSANNFDITRLKLIIKNSGETLHKPSIRPMLTETTKSVLKSIGLGSLLVADDSTDEESLIKMKTELISSISAISNGSQAVRRENKREKSRVYTKGGV